MRQQQRLGSDEAEPLVQSVAWSSPPKHSPLDLSGIAAVNIQSGCECWCGCGCARGCADHSALLQRYTTAFPPTQSVLDLWYVGTILGHPAASRMRPPERSLQKALAFLRLPQPKRGEGRGMLPLYQYIVRASLTRCGVTAGPAGPPWRCVLAQIPPDDVIMRVYLLTHVVLYGTDLGLRPGIDAELRGAGEQLLRSSASASLPQPHPKPA